MHKEIYNQELNFMTASVHCLSVTLPHPPPLKNHRGTSVADPGSFGSWIRHGKKIRIRVKIQDHIYEIVETIFWVK
jgi:hypothetical protein